ncbi:MAG TPA: YbaN family protein [Candidatus Limnocylindrales bacterium]|nr:YbaN family protein [Candidatus Limnocylindrales bacterium]
MPSPADQPSTSAPEPAGVPPATADRSRPIRIAFAIVGTVALAIGLLGIVVPVLPTTPFLLLAAACYARASTRLYAWLLGQPTLGPIIVQWRETGSMAPAVKTRAIIVVVVTFGVSIFVVEPLLFRVLLGLTGGIVTVFLVRIPTTPREPA